MSREKRDKEEILYRLREMAEIIGLDPDQIEHQEWMMEEMHRAWLESRKYFAEGDLKRALQWLLYYRSIREADDLLMDQVIDLLERMVGWKD